MKSVYKDILGLFGLLSVLALLILATVLLVKEKLKTPIRTYTNQELHCVDEFVIESNNLMILIDTNELETVNLYGAWFGIGAIEEWEFIFYDGTVKKYRVTDELKVRRIVMLGSECAE